MGKKKKSQNSNTPISHGDSSESESSKDSTQATEGTKPICPHLSKSVEIAQLRKNIKANKDKSNNFMCLTCKKSNKTDPCQEAWICLRCGSCNCGPGDEDHREDHYKTPRSDTHFLAFQVNSNNIWCFKCQQDIPVDVNKKVQSCAELIKKSCSDQLPFSPVKVEPDLKIGNNSADYLKSESILCRSFQDMSLNNNEVKPVLNLPKVRGLMNLGNTCFFNSVLQCLAQTPGLVDLLREMDVPGEKFHLELDGKTIDAELEKHKQSFLSEQLAQILTEVSGVEQNGTGDARTGSFAVNPRRLLSALTSKCPQFEGGDQHDAHELLRHLLDSVHTEDLRRYQKAILTHIGYNKTLDELDEDKKQFGKKLNQKVCDTIPIRPDQIFKGSLVSILECTVCHHVSKREEPFLDLSLPVAQEKDKPPCLGKKKPNCNSPVEEEDKNTEVASSKFENSKSQKRVCKKSKRSAFSSDSHFRLEKEKGQNAATIEEEEKKDSLDADQSDADVEDNGCEEQDHKAEIVESGYSSEKQMSARGSPVTTQSPEEKTKCDFKQNTEVSLTVSQSCPNNPDSTTSIIEPTKSEVTLSDKNESETVSIQELTVTIPDETHTECTSQDSIRVNVNQNSPNVSSDSQQGSYHRNVESTQGDFKLPDNSDSRADRTAMVYEWNCTGTLQSRSGESLSVSPQCDSGSSPENNISPKESVLSGSQSNENMSLCTSIPLSNDNMSVCNSLPENVSIILNSPTKSQKDESGSDERPESRMECETSRILKSRSSPVNMEESTKLDSGLLKLSLEGMSLVHNLDELDSNSSNKWSDESPKKLKEAEPQLASKSPIPLPPPLPLFSTPCSLNLTKTPQPSVVQRNSFINPLPKYKFEEGECSLQSCLNQFTLIEVLFGANKVGCEACTEKNNKGKEGKTVYQNSTKQLLISKLPPVVIFHLKRFQVQRFSFRKISKHVEFPLILDISQFCTDENKKGPILYSLYGVVEHSGTLHGGHYVAYVKVRCHTVAKLGQAPPGKWYYISDSRVSDIDESSVLKTQAYLLFYERIL